MVAVSRGTETAPHFRQVENASVTVLALQPPQPPVVVAHWQAPSSVEGQDRSGALLAVVDIGRGGLWTFNASALSSQAVTDRGRQSELIPSGYVNFTGASSALHVRLYNNESSEQTYALVTSGWAEVSALIVVDVTVISAPREVAMVPLAGLRIPEGVYVVPL